MNESARDALRTLVDVIADGIEAGEISDWSPEPSRPLARPSMANRLTAQRRPSELALMRRKPNDRRG
jgi:hypothetical protein